MIRSLDVHERELVLDAAVPIVTTGIGAGGCSEKPCLRKDINGLF